MAKLDEKVLWEAAEELRGSVPVSEYTQIVLGLIFLKYVSDRYEERKQELIDAGESDFVNDKDFYLEDNVLLLPEKATWNYIKKFAKDETIGQKIDEALILIENENTQFKDLLPKVYSDSEMNQISLGNLVDLFENEINISKNDDPDGDFIGQTYEYFMKEFSRKLGEKGGEFFTPTSVVKLLVSILDPSKGKVYDPCCGSGGMFVQTSSFLKHHQQDVNNVSIYGQELNAQTWKLARMNLAIKNLNANLGDSWGDTFTNDKHKNLKADYIIANPPFNMKKYQFELLRDDKRWVFGLPNPKNANYAWIQHMYSKLSEVGIAAFILANGSLSSNQKDEAEIRKNMLEANVVDAIITLPSKLFYTTSVPACIWVLKKHKKNKDVLFIDARDLGTMINRRNAILTNENIEKISSIYHNWVKNQDYKDIEGFCKSCSLEEIKENDYSLVPGRYVGIVDENPMSEEELQSEITKTANELLKLFDESKELENKVIEILKNNK